MKIFDRKNLNIVVDVDKIVRNVPEEYSESLNNFLDAISTYSRSNELMATSLGRSSEEGGKIAIGWNQFVLLLYAFLTEIGLSKAPHEEKQ